MYGIHDLLIVCVLVVIIYKNIIYKYIVNAGYTENKGRLHDRFYLYHMFDS